MEGPQGNTYQFYDGVNRWDLISYLERIETLSILHSCGGFYALLKFNNLLEERITRAPRGADQPIDTPYFGSDQKSDCISWHNCRSDKSALHNPG